MEALASSSFTYGCILRVRDACGDERTRRTHQARDSVPTSLCATSSRYPRWAHRSAGTAAMAGASGVSGTRGKVVMGRHHWAVSHTLSALQACATARDPSVCGGYVMVDRDGWVGTLQDQRETCVLMKPRLLTAVWAEVHGEHGAHVPRLKAQRGQREPVFIDGSKRVLVWWVGTLPIPKNRYACTHPSPYNARTAERGSARCRPPLR